jgi:hypothetical protein
MRGNHLSLSFARARRFVALSLAAAAIAVASMPAHAGPELDRLFSSVAGRFLMMETAGGRVAAKAVLGRALREGETLESLAAKLNEPAMREVSERLEGRLRLIENEFAREFPGVGAELSVEQRALLRVLAHQELESGALTFVEGAAANGGYDANRQAFASAVAGNGIKPMLRYPAGVEPFLHPDAFIQFGFESEFTMKDLEGLLTVYGPAPEFGVSTDKWLAMPIAERVAWVKTNLKTLFPNVRELGGLVKVNREPSLEFLPERLLRDSTGNLEIVLKPVNTYEEWKRRVFLLNEKVGVGSMQGTTSVTCDVFFGRDSANAPATLIEADLGFFNFHNDLDTLDKLETGAVRYKKDATKPAANSFNHPFLGPMTRLKQTRLIRYLEANARGEMLDEAAMKAVSAEDNSFKYVGGTAYRPDIVPGKVILEVRDAHTNVEALLERMSRSVAYLQYGRSEFVSAAAMPAFDSKVDFEKLPEHVQSMLKKLFPSKMQAGLEYNADEQLALEVFRNFAYPMRDWDAQLRFLGRADLRNTVRLAQRSYSAKLAAVAADLEAGKITAEQASLRVQGAIAEFAPESKLPEAYRHRSKELLDHTVKRHQGGGLRKPA